MTIARHPTRCWLVTTVALATLALIARVAGAAPGEDAPPVPQGAPAGAPPPAAGESPPGAAEEPGAPIVLAPPGSVVPAASDYERCVEQRRVILRSVAFGSFPGEHGGAAKRRELLLRAPICVPGAAGVASSRVHDEAAPEHSSARPPLSEGRVIGEVLVGGLAGVGGLVLGALVGGSLESGCQGDYCGLGAVLLGGYLGGVLGLSLGVYGIGSVGDQGGSYAATLGGTVLGTLAGVGIAYLSQSDGGAVLSLIGGPFLGALIGFNVSRHYDAANRTAVGSLLQVRHGRVALGVPLVSRMRVHDADVTSVPLLGGAF